MKVFVVALLGLVGLVAVVGYAVFKPTPEASGPIRAVAVGKAPAAAPSAAAVRVFEIRPEQSEARFVIDEVLRGEPKTVVGATNQVAGQITVDPNDLDTARLGTILVNARTFATDSNQRDRAIQNFVLQTAEYEYISFTPREVIGLPNRAGAGETLSLQVVGDLAIRGVAREVTFDATVTPESADRLTGRASTTIRYADWGISIPQVPAVTGVSEQVQLQLDFVATPA